MSDDESPQESVESASEQLSGKPCGCIDCPFPPCPCGDGHGSCPGGLCRDCYHESIFESIEEHERENPGALEKRLDELAKLFRSKRREAR